jgi:hypothetical protein
VKAFFQAMATNFQVVGEILSFLWARKLWWLIPMMVVLLAFALVLVFGTTSGIAPFIYTLF